MTRFVLTPPTQEGRPVAKTLFDQLSEAGRAGVAALVGCEDCAPFRNQLRDTPMLPDPFTCGEAADAYLTARLIYLRQQRLTSQVSNEVPN